MPKLKKEDDNLHYDYAKKCDCSDDDNCGCSYPNNMKHDYDNAQNGCQNSDKSNKEKKK